MSQPTSPSDTILLIPEPGKQEAVPVPAADPGEDQPPLRLTPKAVKMVKLTREEEGHKDSCGLRVAVRGGGCSGAAHEDGKSERCFHWLSPNCRRTAEPSRHPRLCV